MRERIAGALHRIDLASADQRYSDYDLNDDAPAARPALRPAAVLVAIVERPDEPTVLLTQRTDHLSSHPGQISFPGGRAEPEDAGPVATALRETREEVGLNPALVEVAGLLDDYETVTGYLVTPVVGFVVPDFELALDEYEVADAFEVPLAFLMDAANRQVHSRLRDGVERQFYAFEYANRYIWGATAGMLVNFQRRLAAVDRSNQSARLNTPANRSKTGS
ncbi:MAG: CoA pyrophosphatase [Gammaproteobacteria bacterium]